jgi:hypothetical protein
MRLMLLTGLALAACAPAPKGAELVTRYDRALIRKLVEPMGYKVTTEATPTHEAKPALTFTATNGAVFTAQGEVCDGNANAACKSVILSARIPTDKADGFDRLAYANHFNGDEAAVYMWTEDGDIRLTGYVILDGGISEEAFRQSLQAFSTVLHQNYNFLNRKQDDLK